MLIAATLLASCSTQQGTDKQRYSVHGLVEVKGKRLPAIWYTDTFEVIRDTIVITNSDSSQWRIAPPYTIYVKN